MKEIIINDFRISKVGIYFFDLSVSKDLSNPMLQYVARTDGDQS